MILAKKIDLCGTAFMRWAMVQRGNAEMYRKSGLVISISREQGRHYDAGLEVPVLPT